MARKRHRRDDNDNPDRWLVSYADFVTLLFAFFVVMYAISSVNEGKYRVLADTMADAFNADPAAARGSPARPADPTEARADEPVVDLFDPLTQIATDFRAAMSPFANDDMVSVRREDFWVELELNTTFLFESGSAHLEEEAIPILRRVAGVLKKYPNPIQVEGFTDNVPINNAAYPSNWELSAARAASVVHVFMEDGVRPELMTAVGFGEYRPVADNATAQGRNRNRRVLVVVLANQDARRWPAIQRARGG